MQSDKHRFFSLAAVVAASVLFGMVLAGALNVTPPADADRHTAAASETTSQSFDVPDFAALAERVVPSVVSVYSTDIVDPSERQSMPRDPFHFFFGPRRGPEDEDREPMRRESSGSGFFISAEGEILTNNHVIEEADQIRIRLEDDTEYDVEVVGRDPATDIALLRVTDADRDFPYLGLGDSDSVRVAEWVMAVGNPLQMAHTVTVGVVSAKGRVLGLSDSGSSFEDFIQTDAAINLGNSGGPLVNLAGRVIGINTAINAAGQNLGFAVPIDIAKRILPQLRSRGRVVRGYLGISVRNVDQRIAEAFGLDSRDGAFVHEVLEDHAAEKGGVRHGDVIVDIDGAKVTDTRDLIDTVSSLAPGTEVDLGIIRDGKRIAVEVELEERAPTEEPPELEEEFQEEEQATSRVGITVSELTDRARQFYGLEEDLEGVVITRVRPVSPAGEEGLIRGDVITEANGRSVEATDDLIDIISGVDEGGYLRLYVYRPRADRSFFAILKLDE
jgi:serine protease Do